MDNKSNIENTLASESSVFDLKRFTMTDSSFKRFSMETTAELLSELNVVSKISVSNKTVEVFIEVSLSAKNKKEEDVFTIVANYLGAFGFKDDQNIKVVESFARGNAPAILYPLIRASISSQSLAAEIAPIRLPVINFFKFPVLVETV